MKKISGIYKIICLGNNKIYIGSSQDIYYRWNVHRKRLENNTHINPHLQNAWDKYTSDLFVFEIIEECIIEQLLLREQFWMDETVCYDREKGFNNCIKADRPLGYKHTDEAKLIMSNLKKGNKLSVEHVELIRQKNLGKTRTEEEKQYMSLIKMGDLNPMYGKKLSEEVRIQKGKALNSVPRWNKGLTKEQDSRLEKLGFWKGQLPPNAINCKLVDIITSEEWVGKSLKELSEISPISMSTLNRLKTGKVGKNIASKYKLEIL